MTGKYLPAFLYLGIIGIVIAAYTAGTYGWWGICAVACLAAGSVVTVSIQLELTYPLSPGQVSLGRLLIEVDDGDRAKLARTRLFVETTGAYVPLYGGFLATINKEPAIVFQTEIPHACVSTAKTPASRV